ncbi:MAG TPA: plastocyanin/azurin family copper-binding protein [Longimicrobium sp.]|nr:plastocyanin/azurin family copper-binding protein [Longimicrobium sp.]
MSTRDLMKLPAIALLALAAACGGGDDAAKTDETAATTEAAAPAAAPATETPAAPAPSGDVVEIKVVSSPDGASGTFEPQNVTVKQGQTIRWVWQDARAAHNVSFTSAQGNPAGAALPQDSPLVAEAGKTYEATITAGPGTYNYVCVPHAMMGMTGSITVQ